MVPPFDTQALAGTSPGAAKRTGTYVGCMFTDYMALVRQGHGRHHSGALMTGDCQRHHPSPRLVCALLLLQWRSHSVKGPTHNEAPPFTSPVRM